MLTHAATPDSPPRLFLIDGSGFIFRAYHSLPPLTRPDGTPVGAVYGFMNMILKLVESMRARPGVDGIAVIFDAARVTFRNRIYQEYKAHRPPAPDDLIPQFAIVRDASCAMGLPSIELADYEADDLIATYARTARAAGYDVIIVSSDKDLMQLIAPGISMYDAMKSKPIGPAEVQEKFGVAPEKLLDVLSLIGDTSDNVPGVPGIGPKTAAELIGEYGNLDTLLARAGEIKQNRRRETLLANIEQAKMSRDLIRLCEDVPLPQTLESLAFQPPNPETLATFAAAQNFKSLLTKLREKFGAAADIPSPPFRGRDGVGGTTPSLTDGHPHPNPLPQAGEGVNYTLVQDVETLCQWVTRAQAVGMVAFDTETTGLDATQAELVGFSLALSPYEACYVPLAHVGYEECHPGVGRDPDAASAARKDSELYRAHGALEIDPGLRRDDKSLQADLFDMPATPQKTLLPGQIARDTALEILKPLLENPGVLKIGHNIKYDMLVLRKYGVNVVSVEDTMLLSYALGAGAYAHNMDDCAHRVLGHSTISYESVTGTGRNKITFAEVPLDKARDYAAEDADVTLRLQHALKPQLISEHLVSVYEAIDRPLIPVLVAMEEAGIKVNPTRLAELSKDFTARMQVFEREIHTLAGVEFSVGSPKQLGEVLFENMGLPGGKKSAKSGAYATGAEVLEELAEQGHIIAEKVLLWRQLAKLKSTYTDSLPQQIHPKTGRVHTSFAMAIASTGRLSSTDPNLQNIPIRTEEGRSIRSAFIAEAGHVLLSADYSQVELRLLAHMADIPVLKQAFRDGIDIHAVTASQMFGVPVDQVDSDLRRKAKTINFGIIYGISAHGLAARLGIGRGEAGDYIKRYFDQYPGIRDYMERTKEFARAHGYVTTLWGRRCHVPGIADKNPNMRAFSERAAINAPLQGTAADIIKRAMVDLYGALRADNLPAKMLLQVHDELVLEVRADALDMVAARVKKIMESAAHLSIPLTVETGTGLHWGEAH